jgi:cobalt-zinc-cadmium efflux system outer membrane protein
MRIAVKKEIWVWAVVMGGFSLPVWSADPPPLAPKVAASPAINLPALGLQDLIELLKQHNPQLKSASSAAVALQLGVQPAQALDNPTVNINQDPLRNSPLNVNSSTAMAWGVTQNIPWPGKRRLAGEIVQAQADSSKALVEQLAAQLVGQLRTSWTSWQQTEAQIRINQLQAQRLDQIKEVTKIRYANNAAAFSDYVNAQVIQAQLQTDLLGLKRQQKVLEQQIATLVGTDKPLRLRTEDGKPAGQAVALDDLEQKALAINPQLKASQFQVDSAKRNVELAELGKLPDLSVGMTAHSKSPPWGFGTTDSYGLMLGVTFPLYYASKEKNLIDQAKAYLVSAVDADEAARQQVTLAVRSAYFQWTQSLDQLKLIQERVIKQAQIGYRLALTNYSNGQSSYIDLLTAFNTLKSAEVALEQSLASAVQAKVSLDVAVGDMN